MFDDLLAMLVVVLCFGGLRASGCWVWLICLDLVVILFVWSWFAHMLLACLLRCLSSCLPAYALIGLYYMLVCLFVICCLLLFVGFWAYFVT